MHANIGSLSLTGQLGTTIRCSGLWDGRPVATAHSEDSELRAKKDVRTRCCGYILTGILSTTLYVPQMPNVIVVTSLLAYILSIIILPKKKS